MAPHFNKHGVSHPMNLTKRRAIRIVIVSDNHLVQLGLQQILESVKCIRVVGQCIGGPKAEELVRREKPQVVIVDMEPEVDIIGLILKLKAIGQDSKIILLSGFADTERTRETFASGVDGIVLKVQPPAVLIAAIECLCPTPPMPTPEPTVTDGLTVAEATLSSPATESYAVKWPSALTERERAVIVLIGQGLTNKDIANRLCISGITVRHHLTSIFDKLGVTSRQKLLIRAHHYGLVALTASA